MTFPKSVQVKLVLLIRFHMITWTNTRASVMYCNFIQCHDLWVMYPQCLCNVCDHDFFTKLNRNEPSFSFKYSWFHGNNSAEYSSNNFSLRSSSLFIRFSENNIYKRFCKVRLPKVWDHVHPALLYLRINTNIHLFSSVKMWISFQYILIYKKKHNSAIWEIWG